MKCVVDVAKTDNIYKLYPKRKQKKKKKYNSVKLFDYASYSMLLYSAAQRDRERINM